MMEMPFEVVASTAEGQRYRIVAENRGIARASVGGDAISGVTDLALGLLSALRHRREGWTIVVQPVPPRLRGRWRERAQSRESAISRARSLEAMINAGMWNPRVGPAPIP